MRRDDDEAAEASWNLRASAVQAIEDRAIPAVLRFAAAPRRLRPARRFD
jgi:hypothetical protein